MLATTVNRTCRGENETKPLVTEQKLSCEMIAKEKNQFFGCKIFV